MGLLGRILRVPAADPDDARRRRLLNILLAGLFIISVLVLVVVAVSGVFTLGGRARSRSLTLASTVMLVGIVAVFLINRYVSGVLASSIFLVLLTVAIAFADEPVQVVEGRSVFLFTIPILMASVILRPWASFAVAGLAAAVTTPIALQADIVPPVPTMLGFFAFALIAWLSSQTLENALQELRAINAELDQRVEERTSELRQANRRLERVNERLMELDRLKSRFVSMVSHELRTPLGAIQGFTEMLREGVYGPLEPKQDDALLRIERNTNKLLHIVNDLLDQARIEAGELSLQRGPFSPDELAADLQSTVGMLADEKGLSFTTAVDDDVPRPLYGDQKRLHQVLVNLTNNAIKFTEEGGVHVHLALPNKNHPSCWSVAVSDTGPGICEEDQDLVFTPFRRVDDSMTREHTGVGLGLSIVKQLVELMDGEITLESEQGRGSTFTVVLPLDEARRRA